ncbi:MAG: 4Fe-4S dicluster domain-containing protein [Proteobacteria bacterium]|nr:4Fe-4S dicluster domain-containing protein [Pseudomonadota bacterium]
MGHITAKESYKRLRERLDRYPVGAAGDNTIYEILKIVYTPEEAALAARLPIKMSSLDAISRKTGEDGDSLKARLEKMAAKGLVMDFTIGDKTRYMLSPTVVGFFEFSMMRLRPDIDQKTLGRLFHRYLTEESDFFEKLQHNKTSLFRTLIHEETIPESYSEVLDYEKATRVVGDAGRYALGLCHCRHATHHMGRDCSMFGMESCLTLGPVVDYLVRRGIAREITEGEALELIGKSREAGLVHISDNVQRRPTFICNCCSCCCEVLLSFKNFDFLDNTFSSNFQAQVDDSECTGCKKCKKACPVDAITAGKKTRTIDNKKVTFLPEVDVEACLGCGVCALKCDTASMQMIPRAQRRVVPESAFARAITMAVEQERLHELLIDKRDGMTAYVANALIGAVLKLPPAKQMLARDTFKSRFVDFVLTRAAGGSSRKKKNSAS